MILFTYLVRIEAILLATGPSTSTIHIPSSVGVVSSLKSVIDESLKLCREYSNGE
jgi:hypothetical protein